MQFHSVIHALFFIPQFLSLGNMEWFLHVTATIYLKHVFVALLQESYPLSQSFILAIFIELSKNQTIMLLQCLYHSYNALSTLIVLRHSWTVWSLLLGKIIFAFKQLVHLLQVGAIALSYLLFYWWFRYRTSS